MNTQKARKIAVYNNKGGVGKTTSVINIAFSMQKAGKKVLVVDCDSQANCFSFFMTAQTVDKILPTEFDSIKHTTWTQYAGITEDEKCVFDYILFDLPPAMTDDVREIIRHTGMVYVPTMLGAFEASGLEKVTEEVIRLGAKIGGIFITMFKKQNDTEMHELFRNSLQSLLMQTIIPNSDTVRESQKAGLPIEQYFIEKKVPRTPSSWKIVNAYDSLAAEIMER